MTTLVVMQKTQTIDDFRNVDGDWKLSKLWTTATLLTILNHAPPQGYVWSGREINENTSNVEAWLRMA